MRPPSRVIPLLVPALCGLALLPAAARATYSIIAIDADAGELGGAGTSCVGSLSLSTILGFADGAGVVAAQAQINTSGRDRAVQLLGQGSTPAAIIADITAFPFDFTPGTRQYAVLDLDGGAAGYTGAQTMPYADDRQGRIGSLSYSTQGNILTSKAVLDQVEAVLTDSASGCDLAETLMLALEAGGKNGEGDSRCTGDGIPSDSAHLRVDDEAGNTLIDLGVTNTAPMNPLVLLRAKFDDWRRTHPCGPGRPAEGDAGNPAAWPDASVADASITDASTSADASTGSSDAGARDASLPGPMALPDASSTLEGGASAPEERDNHGGCSVRTTAPRPFALGAFLLLASVLRWRRGRRRA